VRRIFKLILSGLLLALFSGSICKSPTEVVNHNPEIQNLIISKKVVNYNEKVSLLAVIFDEDGDTLSTDWSASTGFFSFTSLDSAVWNAPNTSGTAMIYVKVKDKRNGVAEDSTSVITNNRLPVISSVSASPENVIVGNIVDLECEASDPDGGQVTYQWTCNSGVFSNPDEPTTQWTSPLNPMLAEIILTVTDQDNGVRKDTVDVNVFIELGSVWITDTFNKEIVKLSPEGRELFRIGGFDLPVGLDINLNDRTVVAVDKDGDKAVRISPEGNILKTVSNLNSPNSVSVYSFTGDFWLTQEGDSSQVVALSSDGSRFLKKISGFKNPRGVSINQTTGDIWIADTGNNRVVKLDNNVPKNYNINKTYPPDSIFFEIYTGFKNPTHLSVNSRSGNCWVSDKDNNRVVRILYDGSEMLEITGFLSPAGIAVNKNDGSCWVANKGDNEVIKLFSNLSQEISGYNIKEKQGFHHVITGYLKPQAITINTENTTMAIVWFSEEIKIVKIRDEGMKIPVIMGDFTGFNSPRALVVNPGE